MRVSSVALIFAALAVMPLAAMGENGQSAPAAATPVGTTPAPAGTSVDQASDLDTVICKNLPPPTGTRLGARRICDTKRRWLAVQQSSQDDLTKLRTRGNQSVPGVAP
jgi:hypothetical protein